MVELPTTSDEHQEGSLSRFLSNSRTSSGLDHFKLDKDNKFTDVIFGSIAGFAGKIVEFPFDTVKVRLQTQPIERANAATPRASAKTTASVPRQGVPPKPVFAGSVDCLRKTLRTEGLAGLYKGLSSPLVGSMLENAVLFVSYSQIQTLIRSTQGLSAEADLSVSQLASAGALSGAVVSFVLTPVELVKCQLQVRDVEMLYKTSPSIKPRPKGMIAQPIKPSPPFQIFGLPAFSNPQRASFTPTATLHSCRAAALPSTPMSVLLSTVREKGLKGLYCGHFGTFLRETAGGAAWFGIYEYLGKQCMAYSHLSHKDQLSNAQTIFAGACAGMAYNAALFPADVIKSRQQTESIQRGFFEIGRELWRGEGYRGFYRGFGITIARSVPASAVIFWSYEWMKRNMTH